MVTKNRKGDMTAWGVIFSILLGLLVAYLVYSFATGTFNPLISVTKNLPKEAQTAIGMCNVINYAGDQLNNAYCFQARDTAKSDRKVTCGYLNTNKLLTKDVACNDNAGAVIPAETIAQKVCIEEFKVKFNAKLFVNDKLCAPLVSCDDLGGIPETTKGNCAAQQKTELTGLKGSNFCCI